MVYSKRGTGDFLSPAVTHYITVKMRILTPGGCKQLINPLDIYEALAFRATHQLAQSLRPQVLQTGVYVQIRVVT